MKLPALLLATAGLTGCVAYPVPSGASSGYYYDQGGYYGQPYAVEPQSVYIYESGSYRTDRGDRRGRRDQDRDGIPNRFDRDRDGDGVPNREDRRPNNPRRN